ncbi:MAG: hypothetical protein N2110_04710 [Flavobacteriales bacterium]|nr:hypothetical protein [Flavobacteriales bacterium]MCX7768310.1 hypothetical protein [Flavobacteriales bacterium]MDW8409938.1 hypothetical protein [Flavobacteriales bacterium]
MAAIPFFHPEEQFYYGYERQYDTCQREPGECTPFFISPEPRSYTHQSGHYQAEPQVRVAQEIIWPQPAPGWA